MVKNLPAKQETQVQSLGWEDPLEKRMVTHPFLPGEFHGQRSLAGYSLCGCKESDTTEQLTLSHTKNKIGREGDRQEYLSVLEKHKPKRNN